MRNALPAIALLMASSMSSAQPAQSSLCPFAADYLSKHFGMAFKPGIAEPGIVGKACTYSASGVKIWIDAGPNPAPSADMYRKMSNPPGTTFSAVPGDPDEAVLIHTKGDVPPFPALSYERKGWLVNITVTGVSGKSSVNAWNAKLVQLKRIP